MTSRSRALAHFKRVDPQFYAATTAYHAALPEELTQKRTRAHLFEALVSIVVSQQLGTAAAESIFMRVKAACGQRITPESLSGLSVTTLRAQGLSGAKCKTLRALATAVERDELDILALKKIPESDALTRLQAIWGFGPWSAEMFLMFALGRRDVFSPGDLGLRRAIEALYALPRDTSRDIVLRLTTVWVPYRTFASLLLWRYRDAKH